ncbi:MAG: hypothetical protein O2780_18240 [Proteobacteria bacterium]|nr:hypothetical protein [Pseudomonadota bacterium]MDA1299751.1 hypothetical protein [Pseudomonadota bacterium]
MTLVSGLSALHFKVDHPNSQDRVRVRHAVVMRGNVPDRKRLGRKFHESPPDTDDSVVVSGIGQP